MTFLFRSPTVPLRRFCAYPAVSPTRDPRFKSISGPDISHFKSILGNDGVIIDPADLVAFNRDWMGRFEGQSSVALRPQSIEHVSQIISYCNAQNLKVVPQGGNTGLVGGSVPVFDEVVLSMARMNPIEHFDETGGVVQVQAGVVLEKLDEYVGDKGWRVPLDLGAEGSCMTGGNVATNAGGSRFIRYGSLRGSVLGLECVL